MMSGFWLKNCRLNRLNTRLSLMTVDLKYNNWYILIKKMCAYGEIVKRLANPRLNRF
jgi:hypothetical protein